MATDSHSRGCQVTPHWEYIPSCPESYRKEPLKDQDGILNPDHIAENYWYLHTQPRDAWTFELDLRPYMERW